MKITFLISTLLLSLVCLAQTPAKAIYWQNPSFEGEPQDATVPIGWVACEALTTPDILPGVWGVYLEASDGETYTGLITRNNNTWESITQRLSKKINTKECYSFNVDLARAATYSGYNGALKLRVWGSTNKCTKDQLLYESPLIKHTFWKQYKCNFTAEQPIRYIIIEAFYEESGFSYEGNILIDNLSPLQSCPRA